MSSTFKYYVWKSDVTVRRKANTFKRLKHNQEINENNK